MRKDFRRHFEKRPGVIKWLRGKGETRRGFVSYFAARVAIYERISWGGRKSEIRALHHNGARQST